MSQYKTRSSAVAVIADCTAYEYSTATDCCLEWPWSASVFIYLFIVLSWSGLLLLWLNNTSYSKSVRKRE